LIIHELATNAAKYGALSNAVGRVDLTWNLHDGQLMLCWIETGGPPVTAPNTKGFGTKIIEASLNAPRGDSARFTWHPQGLHCEIALSLSAQRKEGLATIEPARDAKSSGKRRRILVVEDEGLVGALTSELIDQMGYSALGPCVDLGEAMSVMHRNHIDAAVLDVNLGGELVFPLAKALADRSIPIVFLTGYEKTVVADGFESCPILQKPVAADELRAALAMMLAPAPRAGSVG
jgi:CheY-like chemotaxis protein